MEIWLWTGNFHNNTQGDGVQECLPIHCITKENDICKSIFEEKLQKTYMNICTLNSEL